MTRFYNHSKVFDFRNIKLAFFELQVKVKLSHPLENTAGSFIMDLCIRGGNEKVIHIDDKPPLSYHILDRVIHESLESGWRVVETEEHDGRFEEPLVHDEACFPLVAILDVDVVVSSMNIEFGEVMSVFQLFYKIRDEEKG